MHCQEQTYPGEAGLRMSVCTRFSGGRWLWSSRQVAGTAGCKEAWRVTGPTWPTQIVHAPWARGGPEPLAEGGVMSRSGM